jgi:phage-related protein
VRHQANYKPVAWVGSSKKDLKNFPEAVQGSIGDALQEAQYGRKSASAKPLSGFHGAGVLEIIDNDDGDTYRAVYTVRFSEVIYVLHAFQKKSRQGIQTSKRDIDLIHSRLKTAESSHREWLTLQLKEEEHGKEN